jgi:hypothetical protein
MPNGVRKTGPEVCGEVQWKGLPTQGHDSLSLYISPLMVHCDFIRPQELQVPPC